MQLIFPFIFPPLQSPLQRMSSPELSITMGRTSEVSFFSLATTGMEIEKFSFQDFLFRFLYDWLEPVNVLRPRVFSWYFTAGFMYALIFLLFFPLLILIMNLRFFNGLQVVTKSCKGFGAMVIAIWFPLKEGIVLCV